MKCDNCSWKIEGLCKGDVGECQYYTPDEIVPSSKAKTLFWICLGLLILCLIVGG